MRHFLVLRYQLVRAYQSEMSENPALEEANISVTPWEIALDEVNRIKSVLSWWLRMDSDCLAKDILVRFSKVFAVPLVSTTTSLPS
jgi:hypothetical protein